MSVSSSISGGGGGAAGAGTGDVVGPASSTDNAVARFNGAGGKTLQNSVVTVGDTGAVAGVTQLDVDNIRVDANTISSTDANGDILLDPNGTGDVEVVSGNLLLANPLAVAEGGTGAATLTANGVLVGAGTGAVAATAVGTAGQVLTSNGVGLDPTFQAAAGVSDHGALTGLADDDHTQYLLADGTRGATLLDVDNLRLDVNTISSTNVDGDILLDPNGTGDVEVVSGNLLLANPLAVAEGGTGAGTFTDAGVLIGNGTGAIAVTTAGTAGQVLTSNGAGVDPTFQDAAAGSGDVVGPASATDNALARFDTTTGKLLQDGVVTSDDVGVVGGVTQLNVDNLRLDGNTVSATGGVLTVSSPSAQHIQFTPGAINRWHLHGSSGSLLANSDNAIDIGASGATRPRNLFLGGYFIGGRLVEANTAGSGAPNVLSAIESRTLLSNEGSTAENYHTLPSCSAGLEFFFNAIDADGIRVTAAAGDEIEVAGVVSAVAGFIRLPAFAKVHLVGLNATRWSAQSSFGTITVDA